jgi:uncharacterized protein
MSLNLNIRQLESGAFHVSGVLGPGEIDWEFEDEMVRPGPVTFDLEAQRLEADLLVQGSLGVDVECECVRCLKKFNYRLDLPGWACHIPWEGEDRAQIANDCVDLTPYIREDILLELPQHPLCQTECPGLLKKPPASPGQMEGTGRSDRTSPAWSELNKLKFEQ